MAPSQKDRRLVNTCRWSASRESTFHECQKRYWYSYYGAWEGWPKTPFDQRTSIDPLASHLYMLKNMQPACVFMGSLVHKVIEKALQTVQKSKKPPSSEELISQTALLYDRGIEESKSHEWKASPKHHINILEHFYGLPFGESEEKEGRERAIACITNWRNSPCITNIALHPKSEWMGIETTQTFSPEKGVEAIVVYDFFLRWPRADGSKTMIIFDWKTGQESKKIEDQLCAYALAAQSIFSVSLDGLILVPFYLSAGPEGYKKYGTGQERPLDSSHLAAMRSRIIESSRQMMALHPPADDNGVVPAPDPARFSYASDRRGCRRCPFQQMCLAADFQHVSHAKLSTLIPRDTPSSS